jgi:hypothetical protein
MSVQTNQVRNLYVVKNYIKNSDTTAVSKVGDLKCKTAKSGGYYFEYYGAGGVITTDIIDPIALQHGVKYPWLIATPAINLCPQLKKTIIELDSNVNGGQPVAGRNYIVRVAIKNYIDMSDESIYTKYGVVAATTGMTASDFYKTLALSFAKNFSREVTKFFGIYLSVNGGTYAEVTSATKVSDLTGNYEGVELRELQQQDYIRGVVPMRTLNYEVVADEITLNGAEVVPLVMTDECYDYIPNGYDLADTEYFCMGERGDRLRMAGYPNVVYTKYLVDETLPYDCLDLDFAYMGEGVDHKVSKKGILFVVPTDMITMLGGKVSSIIDDIQDDLGFA